MNMENRRSRCQIDEPKAPATGSVVLPCPELELLEDEELELLEDEELELELLNSEMSHNQP